MNKRNILIAASAMLLAAGSVKAQTVEDGLKDLYYQKYSSANQDFQKVIAAKPTEERAYYYQGIAQLGLGDNAGAAATFQKGLAAVPNSPLLTAGLGRIDLLNGNVDAAKQKFEAANAATRGLNPDVARAIADANSEIKGGDRGYAASVMEKLLNNEDGRKKKEMVTPTAADYIELGDAYRALGGENGGKALTAYDKALELDANNAEAVTKEGMLNYNARLKEQAVADWTKATNMDPKYGPAFYQLFQFYVTPKKDQLSWENAAKYLQSYIAVADPADKNESTYNQAAIAFYQKNYDQAISTAQSGLASANPAYKGKFTRLMGDAYLQKGDSLTAMKTMDDYVKGIGNNAKLEPNDYKLLAAVYGKVRVSDTTEQNRIDSMASIYEENYALSDTTKDAERYRSVAEAFKNMRDYKKSAEWYGKLVSDFPDDQNPSKIQDFFWKGTMEMYSHQYVAADSTFSQFTAKYPQQEILGTYWRGRANMAQDPEAKEGKAVEIFKHWAEIGGEEKTKPKDKMYPYQYLMIYYYNKEDKDNLKVYEDKVLSIDPGNATVKQIQDNIESVEKSKAAANKPAAKPHK